MAIRGFSAAFIHAVVASCLFCIGIGAVFANDNTPPPPGKVIGAQHYELPSWFKQSFLEIADDVDEAQNENKHVLLFFHLEACPYCYKMVEENFKNSSYSEYLQANFDVIEINVRGDRDVIFNDEVSLSEKELAQHLKVRYTPTTIFLGPGNKPVLRLNGYRSVTAFKHALDFIVDKAYQQTTLAHYVANKVEDKIYTLREHPNFSTVADLSQLPDKPLLVLFEDRTCDECATLHDEILSLDETKALLNHFTVVRLDALSEQSLVDLQGHTTTAKEFAAALAISYRPGIVLFDRGEEIHRIDGMQYRYHFQEILRYVGERYYAAYPEFRDYMRMREASILSSGQDIYIGR